MNIWREYSVNHVKKNKAASISILAAAFIAAVLLSLTSGIFYNVFVSDIRQIEAREGGWHGSLTGDISDHDIALLKRNPDIKEITVTEDSGGFGKTALLTYYNPRHVYQTLPQIAGEIGIDTERKDTLAYHSSLLEKHFIFPRGEFSIPSVAIMYIFVTLIACLSLIMIIHNAFGVSMNARLHQLGILQSIGATPRQLRTVLIQESLLLCLIPILAGVSGGAVLCKVFMVMIERATRTARNYDLVFEYHLLIPVAAVLVSLLTVWASSRIPAKRISRMSPLEAIRYGGELSIGKMKGFSLLSHLLGIHGELARKSLYVRRKAFRTAVLSLMLSFLAFSIFLNIETISRISTQYTFFERYKNRWDLMLTVPDSEENEEDVLSRIRRMPGVQTCISYRKAQAYTYLAEDNLSDEIAELGGLDRLADINIQKIDGQYRIETPVFILDDESYRSYYDSIRPEDTISGLERGDVIVINTIWDTVHSDRRERKMIPMIRGDIAVIELITRAGESGADITLPVRVTAHTDIFPTLREERPDFSLVQVMPESTYREVAGVLPTTETYYNILANSDEAIADIDSSLRSLTDGMEDCVLRNRLETERSNQTIRNSYTIAIMALAGLLACIGLANVFSNILGYLPQRKREFTRYLTCGLSPKGAGKVLCMEAGILAMRPILISLLINVPVVFLALDSALIKPSEFFAEMPIGPIAIFACSIILAIGFSYYLGGRKLLKSDIIKVLRDDTMM